MTSLIVISAWLILLPLLAFSLGLFSKGPFAPKVPAIAGVLGFEFICLLPLRSFCMTRGIQGARLTDLSRYAVVPKSFVMAGFFVIFLGGFISVTVLAGNMARDSILKNPAKVEILNKPGLIFGHFTLFMVYALLAAFDLIPH